MSNSPLWNLFPELVARVREDHKKQKGVSFGGHNFEHAVAVAQYGQMIAEDEKTGTLAWVAGLCHNTDRIFPGSSDGEIKMKLGEYLELAHFSDDEKSLITESVLEHSKKNDPSDNQITVVLKDADRLDNAGALVCIRSAQYYHNLPPVDYAHLFADPQVTFKNPGSIARDIANCVEWESWLRLPKAKTLGAPKFAFMRAFLAELERDVREVGLHPYPFPPEE